MWRTNALVLTTVAFLFWLKENIFSFLLVRPVSHLFLLQDRGRPLFSDSHVPLYVLSIQERAELLAAHFEGKPAGPQVKFLFNTRN